MRYFNPEVALKVQVPDYNGVFDSIQEGMQLGGQIKQLRQSGILSQLLAQNTDAEGKVDYNKALQSVQSNPNQSYQPTMVNTLSGLIQQNNAARLKAQQDALKSEADLNKTYAETKYKELGTTQKGQTLLSNLVATSTDVGDAMRKLEVLGTQYGLPSETIQSTLNDLKALAANNQGSPEAFQKFQKSYSLLGTEKPIEYLMPKADTVANNETSIANNKLTNQTSRENNQATVNATLSGQQVQLTIAEAKSKAEKEGGTVQIFGGNAYYIDKQGNAKPISTDINGQPINARKSGVGTLPTPALKIVTEAQGKVGEADLAITKLDKLLGNVDVAMLSPWNNFTSGLKNFTGNSDVQSQAYERVVSGLKDAANAILMSAKGVQTDGDAQRAERIVMASRSNDPQVVKNAINDLKDFSEEVKLRYQNQIGGVYANYGLDPNDYFSGQISSETQPPSDNLPKGGMSFRANDVLKAAKARGVSIQEMERIIKSTGGTIVK